MIRLLDGCFPAARRVAPRPAARCSPVRKTETIMDRYDPKSALEELNEDALLPHPVRLRDMILRMNVGAGEALDLNREFQNYLTLFGQTQQIGREILQKLVAGPLKQP
jgi:hypothetical protein